MQWPLACPQGTLWRVPSQVTVSIAVIRLCSHWRLPQGCSNNWGLPKTASLILMPLLIDFLKSKLHLSIIWLHGRMKHLVKPHKFLIIFLHLLSSIILNWVSSILRSWPVNSSPVWLSSRMTCVWWVLIHCSYPFLFRLSSLWTVGWLKKKWVITVVEQPEPSDVVTAKYYSWFVSSLAVLKDKHSLLYDSEMYSWV